MTTTTDWEVVWRQAADRTFELGAELLRDAPDDDLSRAEALRYAARLIRNAIGTQLEPRRPGTPTVRHDSARVGGDNPDYRYGRVALDGALEYRLRIVPGDTARFALGTYSGGLGTQQGLQNDDQVDSEDLVPQPDGSYLIFLSQQPGESTAHQLRMTPGTRMLTIRETLLRPETDEPARIEIECLTPGSDQPETATDISAAIDRALVSAKGIARQFVGWTQTFAARPNEVYPLSEALLSVAQGDRGAQYFNGYYLLPHAQAQLEVCFTPPAAKYWNIQACNHWLESLDPVLGRSSINLATATHEPDGSVRVLFSPTPPGDAQVNWIDTAGHLRGCIALRVVGAAEPGLAIDCRLLDVA